MNLCPVISLNRAAWFRVRRTTDQLQALSYFQLHTVNEPELLFSNEFSSIFKFQCIRVKLARQGIRNGIAQSTHKHACRQNLKDRKKWKYVEPYLSLGREVPLDKARIPIKATSNNHNYSIRAFILYIHIFCIEDTWVKHPFISVYEDKHEVKIGEAISPCQCISVKFP